MTCEDIKCASKLQTPQQQQSLSFEGQAIFKFHPMAFAGMILESLQWPVKKVTKLSGVIKLEAQVLKLGWQILKLDTSGYYAFVFDNGIPWLVEIQLVVSWNRCDFPWTKPSSYWNTPIVGIPQFGCFNWIEIQFGSCFIVFLTMEFPGFSKLTFHLGCFKSPPYWSLTQELKGREILDSRGNPTVEVGRNDGTWSLGGKLRSPWVNQICFGLFCLMAIENGVYIGIYIYSISDHFRQATSEI